MISQYDSRSDADATPTTQEELLRDSPAIHSNVASQPGAAIDYLVRDLRKLYLAGNVQVSVDVGRIIIERLFGGDLRQWRLRGRKDVSFRKLEKHPELPFRASTLSRAVAIYMLSQRRADLAALTNVSPSHLYEIAGLDDKEQDRLLDRVESDRWSTRKLRQEVAAAAVQREGQKRTRGNARPPAIAWLRGIRRQGIAESLTLDRKALETLDLGEARELLEITRSLLQHLDAIARALGQHVSDLNRARRPSDVVPAGVPAPEHRRIA